MTDFPSAKLIEFATNLLSGVGVPRGDAAAVATSLVGANLRGHDSHGVMRVLQYVDFIERGDIRIGVDLRVVQETPALVVCDGQWGLGQVQSHRLLDLLIPKARGLGVAVGAARDCGHIGRLGEYAERTASEGLMLMATVNNCGGFQRVAPPGGIEPRLSTNPFCASVPTNDPEAPIVVDFGTSVVAEGKVRGYYISQSRVPEGWLLDHQGKPTTDPAVLYEPPLGTILPLGGPQSYKGFGLALVLELWAGGLTGGRCSAPEARPVGGNNVFFVLFSPDQFAGSEHVYDQSSRLAEFVRATPRASGIDAILLPGDPERLAFEHRSIQGIPIDEKLHARLTELALRLGVTPLR
jgi:LDH2 family malate/lactate/ureidoglycolate dehydrogenase